MRMVFSKQYSERKNSMTERAHILKKWEERKIWGEKEMVEDKIKER